MSLQACADLVRRGDPDRFLAAMAAPVPARRVLFPLYAFNVEVARAPWMTQEPAIAEIRLQWWRDALDEIAAGGPVRRHEVVGPLAALLDAEAAGLLDTLVAARRWDVWREPFTDQAAFDAYIAATSGNLTWVAARALGASDPGPVRDLGQAAGIAGFLRAAADLRARGRIPLADDGDAAIRALAQAGLDRLAAARRARADVPRAAVPALLSTWQTPAILKAARARPARVRRGTLALSPVRARAGLIWHRMTLRW